MQQEFNIEFDPAAMADLKTRIKATRWPDEINNEQWEAGTNKKVLKDFCAYWSEQFDWKKQIDYLNSFNHFKHEVDGFGLHFLHHKGKSKHSLPLLLIHGWPDSFVRFLKIIPLLTEPDEAGLSYDVIIPSIPGFGFSDLPKEPGMNCEKIAKLFQTLMVERLGYKKFMVHGGDWGSTITELMVLNYPENLLGIHLTDIPFHHLFDIAPESLTPPEKEYMTQGQQWQQKEGAYAMILSTKPQTVAYGFNDSPAGLASWILEKFYRWSDIKGDLENSYTKDELLTNITIYWMTQTINSADRLYYETMFSMQGAGKSSSRKEYAKPTTPTAVTIFPKDLIPAPREFADRVFNIQQWTNMSQGGHFAAMEKPKVFAEELRKFGKTLAGS